MEQEQAALKQEEAQQGRGVSRFASEDLVGQAVEAAMREERADWIARQIGIRQEDREKIKKHQARIEERSRQGRKDVVLESARQTLLQVAGIDCCDWVYETPRDAPAASDLDKYLTANYSLTWATCEVGGRHISYCYDISALFVRIFVRDEYYYTRFSSLLDLGFQWNLHNKMGWEDEVEKELES